MAKKYYSSGVAGARQMMERAGGMINDDRSQPCLLPKEVKDNVWPGNESYLLNQHMPDLFRAVEKQMGENSSDARAIYKPSHT